MDEFGDGSTREISLRSRYKVSLKWYFLRVLKYKCCILQGIDDDDESLFSICRYRFYRSRFHAQKYETNFSRAVKQMVDMDLFHGLHNSLEDIKSGKSRANIFFLMTATTGILLGHAIFERHEID
ncbi:hypothetical protein Glove_311g38 [Diversispora epigaea]|uniref:Uncharacterized protein n=1 Tax=Diversispora epigaea TaxID=1348612 RepID=A0A397HUY1_9GLOM|nr:hypothetical protein Glove_311g38 [Diversispora epigaea]